MMIVTKYPIAIISAFLWVGFVCAISFLEAWLKFRAPGITIPLGLGIGRLVFNALNKIEWVFAIAIIISLVFGKGFSFNTFSLREAVSISSASAILLFIPLVMLILQTFWALPMLDARAEIHLTGGTPPHSVLHFYYVGMELIKVGCIVAFGIGLFNRVTI